MARSRAASEYVCQSLRGGRSRWEGQCRSCGAWNSLVETLVRPVSRRSAAGGRRPAGGAQPTAAARPLRSLDGRALARRATGISEVDRLLGGGLVSGSLLLLAGEPGIGKSTLVLQNRGCARGRERRALRQCRGIGHAAAAACLPTGSRRWPRWWRAVRPREHGCRCHHRGGRCQRTSLADRQFGPDGGRRRARWPAWLGRPGARVGSPGWVPLRTGPGGARAARRPCHQGRLARGAKDAGAPRRCRAHAGGGPLRFATAPARAEEPSWLHRGGGRHGDDPGGSARGSGHGRRVPWSWPARGPGRRGGRHPGGQPAAAGGGAGARGASGPAALPAAPWRGWMSTA